MNRLRLACFSTVVAAAATLFPVALHGQTPREATVRAPQEAEDTRTERVTFAGLDLRSKPGQKILFRRVGVAVHNVCDFDDINYDARISCEDDAWDGSKPQIYRAIERAKNFNIASTTISILVTAGK